MKQTHFNIEIVCLCLLASCAFNVYAGSVISSPNVTHAPFLKYPKSHRRLQVICVKYLFVGVNALVINTYNDKTALLLRLRSSGAVRMLSWWLQSTWKSTSLYAGRYEDKMHAVNQRLNVWRCL